MKQGPGVVLFLLLTVFHPGAQTTGDFNFSDLPDTYEARARYLTSVVTTNWNSAVRFPETYLKAAAGRTQISVDRQDDFFYVRFLLEREGAFPLASAGNVVVQRNYLRNGDLIQAKYFLSDDPSCYIRLYPYSERTKADVILYGAVVRQGFVLSQLFYYQLRDPLSRLLAAMKNSLDWGMLYRAPSPQSAVLRLSQALHEGRLSSGGAGGRLISALAVEDTVEKFLAAQGRGSETSELTESPSFPFADDRDPRATAPYKAFPRYEAGRGLPVQASAALAHAESLKDADVLLVAFFQDGSLNRRFLLLPGFDARGIFGIEAYDPSSRTFLDWAEFAAAHHSGRVRLVRSPAPQP